MMKTAMTICLLACLWTVTCNAQENLMETRNNLQRECGLPQASWLTIYNLTLTDLLIAMDTQTSDALFVPLMDESAASLVRLEKMDEADRSEVEALRALRYMALMNRDPAANGPRYAADVSIALEKAVRLNPRNPRAVLLSAIYQKNLSTFMHRVYEEFDDEIEKARVLLHQQDSTRLAPVWGIDLCR